MAETEELKSLLMKVKEESEKIGLKLTIHLPRPAPAGRGAPGASVEPLCTRVNMALQAVQSVPAAVGSQHALLPAALGTAGGCCPGTAHRPCSAVGGVWCFGKCESC